MESAGLAFFCSCWAVSKCKPVCELAWAQDLRIRQGAGSIADRQKKMRGWYKQATTARSWMQTPRPVEKPLAAPNMELIYVNPEGPSGKPVIEDAIKHIRSSFALRCSHSQSLVPGGRGRLPSAVPGFRWKGREQCQFLLRWPDEEGSRSQSLGQDSGDRRTDMLLQDGAIVTVYDPKGEK